MAYWLYVCVCIYRKNRDFFRLKEDSEIAGNYLHTFDRSQDKKRSQIHSESLLTLKHLNNK